MKIAEEDHDCSTGSSFDDLLTELGILDEVHKAALERVEAWQRAQAEKSREQ